MSYEYEPEEDYGSRVLWGRVAFFALALLGALLLGRCTAGGGVDPQDLADSQQQVMALSSEKEQLEQQLDAATASQAGGGQTDEAEVENGGGGNDAGGGGGGGDAAGGGDTAADDSGSEEDGAEDAASTEGAQTYTVQDGDTLTKIAQEFYGDPRKYQLIVDANNIDSATGLRVDQELIIPPEE